MKKVLLIVFLSPLLVFCQIGEKNLPIQLSLVKDVDNITIVINDSIDASNFDNEEDPRYNYSTTVVNLKKDSLLNVDFRFPISGFVKDDDTQFKLTNKLVDLKIEKNCIELLIYFESKIYGNKMYYLKGHFKSVSKGKYTEFVPEGVNIIRSDESERCYLFRKKKVDLMVSTVYKGKYIYRSGDVPKLFKE